MTHTAGVAPLADLQTTATVIAAIFRQCEYLRGVFAYWVLTRREIAFAAGVTVGFAARISPWHTSGVTFSQAAIII